MMEIHDLLEAYNRKLVEEEKLPLRDGGGTEGRR